MGTLLLVGIHSNARQCLHCHPHFEFLQQKVIQWYFTDSTPPKSRGWSSLWLRSVLGCSYTVSTFLILYSFPTPFSTSVLPLVKWRKQEDITASWFNSLLKCIAEEAEFLPKSVLLPGIKIVHMHFSSTAQDTFHVRIQLD